MIKWTVVELISEDPVFPLTHLIVALSQNSYKTTIYQLKLIHTYGNGSSRLVNVHF